MDRTRKRPYLICTLAFMLVGIFSGIVYGGQQSSAAYTIERDVLSCGGQHMSSTRYDLLSTFGQPTAISASSSHNYKHYPGFWYPVDIMIPPKAMPWIPLLLLGD